MNHVYYGPGGTGSRLVPQRVCHHPLGEHVRHGDDVLVAVSSFPEGADEAHTQHLPPALNLDGREFRRQMVSFLAGVTSGTVFYPVSDIICYGQPIILLLNFLLSSPSSLV